MIDERAQQIDKIRMHRKTRRAGAIAAAFELTATPELRARHHVTVYQPGWRLGGKCASGLQDLLRHLQSPTRFERLISA